MSLLNNVQTDDSIGTEKDSVGGFGPKETGLYTANVSMAFLQKSKGGAIGLNLTLKAEDGGEIRQTLWIASGDAKGNKNYYEKDGEKFYLPGFNHANSLALLTVGKEIAQVETENKVVNVYSPEAQAEVPTQVEVLMELLGQDIIVGLQKQIVDKKKKADDGSYQPTGETREENEIDKFFRATDKMTTAEIRAQATEPSFYNTWEQKWTGKTRDRSTKASGNQGNAGAPTGGLGANKPAGGGAKPPEKLFGAQA